MGTLEPHPKHPLLVAWQFLVHIITGAVIFSLVALSTLTFSYLAKLLISFGVPNELVQAITILEYILLAANFCLFMIFLSVIVYTAARRLLER